MTDTLPIPRPLRFNSDEADRANEEWGFNCGPGALCAVLGMTPNELRPSLGDFEQKRYTNPTLMWDILNRLGVKWRLRQGKRDSEIGEPTASLDWPDYGLVRVQWEGPWTAPGVPERVRYRHTHWIGSAGLIDGVFDINSLSSGWVPLHWWQGTLVPWLLGECEPKANGKWHLTHVVEVSP